MRSLPALALCAALLASSLGSAAADEPEGGVLTRFQQLYERRQAAEVEYASLSEQLRTQRAVTLRAGRALARARAELREGQRRASVLAREQYRGTGGFSPALVLLLSRDPQRALAGGEVLARASEHQAAILRGLYVAERRLDRRAAAARAALDKKRSLAERRREQGHTVREQVTEVEELIASLSPAELATVDKALRSRGVLEDGAAAGGSVADGETPEGDAETDGAAAGGEDAVREEPAEGGGE
ncbi:hypothetical protein ACFQLX_17305 [Streptomyces polyrhachis]|uniref:Uncharacterized protein n=1 Tax=Streptomyces polyrhachis TaxID=1282885 RepID=A0ABW2GGY0_9ACTN